jgi:hypothetical protein
VARNDNRPLRTALVALLWLFATGVCARQAGAATYVYELDASLGLKNGLVSDAAWFDADTILTLEISPDGAQVAKTSVSTPRREIFLTREFIAAHICPPECGTRLTMQLSPTRGHVSFRWSDAEGRPGWALLDISGAPQMRLRRIPLPGGMQVGGVLFSPDERYLVLTQDSAQEGSALALLALDLREGEEIWRVEAAKFGFVRQLWWAGGALGGARFKMTASLYEGRFQDSPGLVEADLRKRTLSFTSDTGGLLAGGEAIWGRAEAHRGTGGNAEYFLRPYVAGQDKLADIPLSREPGRLILLAQPGMALLSNSGGDNENELWLIDLFSGTKTQVDGDCDGFDVLSSGSLLVRARKENLLRLYSLRREGKADSSAKSDLAPAASRGGAPGSRGGSRR